MSTLCCIGRVFVHKKGDQASIIGGAIDFVKELEQLLESLEAQRKGEEGGCKAKGELSSVGSRSPTSSAMGMASNGRIGEGVCAEHKSEVAEIEVTMIQTHVNLKIKCPKRQGQLLKAIVALEDLRLTVLHLNISTSQATATMHYSFNLKVLLCPRFPSFFIFLEIEIEEKKIIAVPPFLVNLNQF